MPRRRTFLPIHEVKVLESVHDTVLFRTYMALDWLRDRGWDDEKHFSINMWGGTRGYTSFFFQDHTIAVEFKLHFGGAIPG